MAQIAYGGDPHQIFTYSVDPAIPINGDFILFVSAQAAQRNQRVKALGLCTSNSWGGRLKTVRGNLAFYRLRSFSVQSLALASSGLLGFLGRSVFKPKSGSKKASVVHTQHNSIDGPRFGGPDHPKEAS
ncbi:MAG: hypothetical protein WAT41_00235 [Flavobacteriales bacterium]